MSVPRVNQDRHRRCGADGFGLRQFTPIGIQTICQSDWLTESEQMSAGHLIYFKSQAVAGDTSLELDRKESVLGSLQDPGRYLRPRRERPGFAKGSG